MPEEQVESERGRVHTRLSELKALEHYVNTLHGQYGRWSEKDYEWNKWIPLITREERDLVVRDIYRLIKATVASIEEKPEKGDENTINLKVVGS